jgi:hypothetical protein
MQFMRRRSPPPDPSAILILNSSLRPNSCPKRIFTGGCDPMRRPCAKYTRKTAARFKKTKARKEEIGLELDPLKSKSPVETTGLVGFQKMQARSKRPGLRGLQKS